MGDAVGPRRLLIGSTPLSVIVGRALPDVRDGLKPVHRRILTRCRSRACWPPPAYKKWARVVGEVSASTTPTVTAACTTRWCGWPSHARCATRWSTGRATSARSTAIAGGHGPHRGRITQPRPSCSPISTKRPSIRAQLRREDGSSPTVLRRLPELAAQRRGGIAVGMATKVPPPHNLTQVITRRSPSSTIRRPASNGGDAARPGPRLPHRRHDLRPRRHPGRRTRRAAARSSCVLATRNGGGQRGPRGQSSSPSCRYQVNKTRLIERIAQLVTREEDGGIITRSGDIKRTHVEADRSQRCGGKVRDGNQGRGHRR